MVKLHLITIFIGGLLFFTPNVRSAPIVAEALVARVGKDPVMFSDINRFKDVESILVCIGAKPKESAGPKGPESFQVLLNRYIEEELIYLEAKNKRASGQNRLKETVDKIISKKECYRDWQNFGDKYDSIWASKTKPREGELILIRELEKRLSILNFEKEQIQGDRAVWIRGARVKTTIKLFLDG